MKTQWNYTDLAKAYLKRPDYSAKALSQMFSAVGLKPGAAVCDVGAGVAHLTLHLARGQYQVSAVEPNDAMREGGRERTKDFKNVTWFEGTGESTGRKESAFDLVTFGSSFNVTDRAKALQETVRILKPSGWFAGMWNHRDLKDPVQARLEAFIKSEIPEYGYGTRREDQVEVINSSALFHEVKRLEGNVTHTQSQDDCVRAWESHATLQRQAGARFPAIIHGIRKILVEMKLETVQVPYTTRIWVAQAKAKAAGKKAA